MSKPVKYLFLITITIVALSSCATKRKYSQFLKIASLNDSINNHRQRLLTNMNDSLMRVIAEKDSIIDSLSVRLNMKVVRRVKEKPKPPPELSAPKKSTLTLAEEYERKSLFIYNFTKYIEWPVEYNGVEFVIGVAGDYVVVKELQEFMAQKKVAGKKIIVERYKKGARYNIVYVTNSMIGNFDVIKNYIKTKTLVITDTPVEGSHISFMMDEDKVRYNVDKSGVEKIGLKIGQELMRLAG